MDHSTSISATFHNHDIVPIMTGCFQPSSINHDPCRDEPRHFPEVTFLFAPWHTVRSTQSSPGIIECKHCTYTESDLEEHEALDSLPRPASCGPFSDFESIWQPSSDDSSVSSRGSLRRSNVLQEMVNSTPEEICSSHDPAAHHSVDTTLEELGNRSKNGCSSPTFHSMHVTSSPDIGRRPDTTSDNEPIARPRRPRQANHTSPFQENGRGQDNRSRGAGVRTGSADHAMSNSIRQLQLSQIYPCSASSRDVHKMIQSWERLLKHSKSQLGSSLDDLPVRVENPIGIASKDFRRERSPASQVTYESDSWSRLRENQPPTVDISKMRLLPQQDIISEIAVASIAVHKNPVSHLAPLVRDMMLDKHVFQHCADHASISPSFPDDCDVKIKASAPLGIRSATPCPATEPLETDCPALPTRCIEADPTIPALKASGKETITKSLTPTGSMAALTTRSSWELSIVNAYGGMNGEDDDLRQVDSKICCNTHHDKMASSSSTSLPSSMRTSSTATAKSTAECSISDANQPMPCGESFPGLCEVLDTAPRGPQHQQSSTPLLGSAGTTLPMRMMPSPLRPRSRVLENYSLFPASKPRPLAPMPRLYRSFSSMVRRHDSISEEQYVRKGRLGPSAAGQPRKRSRLWWVTLAKPQDKSSPSKPQQRLFHKDRLVANIQRWGRTIGTVLLCGLPGTNDTEDEVLPHALRHTPGPSISSAHRTSQHVVSCRHGQELSRANCSSTPARPQTGVDKLGTWILTGCDSQQFDGNEGSRRGLGSGKCKIPEARRTEDGARWAVD